MERWSLYWVGGQAVSSYVKKGRNCNINNEDQAKNVALFSNGLWLIETQTHIFLCMAVVSDPRELSV